MLTGEPNRERSGQFFVLGCIAEASLFFLGAGLSWLMGQGILADLHWRWRDAVIGLAGAVPPLGLFWWAVRSRWAPLHRVRQVLEQLAVPIIREWDAGQILVLCVLAGLGEEYFFRAAVQGGLAPLVGAIPALVLAGLVFGACHPMTWAYVVFTSVMGVYLGGLWLWSGNLLVPVVVHAAYDFVAMLYLARSRTDQL